MNGYRSSLIAALLVAAALADALPAFAQAPPVLVSAVSRKVHGGIGTFDLPLSLVPNNPTTEPRSSATVTIVFTFDKPVNGGIASVIEGVATALAPTITGNDISVGLTTVANAQYVTVSLANVTAVDGGTGGSGSARVGFLLGDVNQNRVVSLSDVGLVNGQLAQAVGISNYLKDVNASGTLSLADKAIANANLTNALPSPLLATAIYVASTGNDASPGTPAQPKRSVNAGIAAAATAGYKTVLVAVGSYPEALGVTLVGGVDIFGGYDAVTWLPASSGATAVIGSSSVVPSEGQHLTVLAKNLAEPTQLSDLLIVGPSATSGRGSFAVVAISSSLVMQRVIVQAGDGASGANGANALDATPVNATSPMNGVNGGPAAEFVSSCNDSSRGLPGAGGTNSLGAQTNAGGGGAGGTMDTNCSSFPPNFAATGGFNGQNAALFSATFGSGGAGRPANTQLPGINGQPGRVINGSAGGGGTGITLVGNYPATLGGTSGGTGAPGSGGGGGGGSGGDDTGTDSYGAGGGGGGAGGLAAPGGGSGGAGGGPSVGIYALNANVVVSGGSIQRGTGGRGGNGGGGGRGQDGGTAGIGGPGAGESAQITIPCDFEPTTLLADPDALVLQLRRKAAIVRL